MKIFRGIMNSILVLAVVATFLPGCKKLLGLSRQENYDYKKETLDPNIHMTAREFLLKRADGTPEAPNDTVFRWMKKGLDYCGLDLSEYEKAGRTFIFLHNDAVRGFNASGVMDKGLFFTFPIVNLDQNGNPIMNPLTGLPQTHPATKWEDYSKETVKNFFLYLIGEGIHNYYDLNAENRSVQSLLPPNSTATKESLLGYWDPSLPGFNGAGGKGFDPQGKFTLRIQNNADIAPIVFNDRTSSRSIGFVATNGVVHVYGAALYPSK
ncbi:hypothetical protein [Niabella drilacis]|uniref:Uncharacterized protein n=1 Tax=Niabella drilacis (strain DSM 25811 / CCM 8410 / CCUG 62505 / LMG 26954 / E90) TaxID=1285928 RepID=A0A1G6I7Z3_NIADE|nr:hypothetical protein [Niabella drilacis]SDC02652.1 hypothetical protein SAMN04487894_101130 [Niabella drilacis]